MEIVVGAIVLLVGFWVLCWIVYVVAGSLNDRLDGRQNRFAAGQGLLPRGPSYESNRGPIVAGARVDPSAPRSATPVDLVPFLPSYRGASCEAWIQGNRLVGLRTDGHPLDLPLMPNSSIRRSHDRIILEVPGAPFSVWIHPRDDREMASWLDALAMSNIIEQRGSSSER
jgi:hypothetical protein